MIRLVVRNRAWLTAMVIAGLITPDPHCISPAFLEYDLQSYAAYKHRGVHTASIEESPKVQGPAATRLRDPMSKGVSLDLEPITITVKQSRDRGKNQQDLRTSGTKVTLHLFSSCVTNDANRRTYLGLEAKYHGMFHRYTDRENFAQWLSLRVLTLLL